MEADRYGVPMTVGAAATVAIFDAAIDEYLCWRDVAVGLMQPALESDSAFILGHSTAASLLLLSGARPNDTQVVASLAAARAAAADASPPRAVPSARRRGACAKGPARRRGGLGSGVLEEPRDLLALRLVHDAYFFMADPASLRDSAARVLPHWRAEERGRGYVLGMYSFGLHETGDCRAAEAAGREAVDLNPANTIAVHAVAHVFEMEARPQEGISWLRGLQPWWQTSFGAMHQWWHLALFQLDLGREDEAVAVYDEQMRLTCCSSLFDLVDATALLWRLQLCGVDVGERWRELAEPCLAYVGEHFLAFNDAHIMMAAAQPGVGGADRLELSLRRYIDEASGTNRDITADVGLDAILALRAFAEGDHARTVDILLPIRHKLYRIGGSHTQRDL
ncbi:MAG: tetratricopeptide repeat protein [Rhodospirillales bacterium]|nr:tetratricopeptide repeat protein [Rhodospirillales bacterium]